jgi:hypothetical protein
MHTMSATISPYNPDNTPEMDNSRSRLQPSSNIGTSSYARSPSPPRDSLTQRVLPYASFVSSISSPRTSHTSSVSDAALQHTHSTILPQQSNEPSRSFDASTSSVVPPLPLSVVSPSPRHASPHHATLAVIPGSTTASNYSADVSYPASPPSALGILRIDDIRRSRDCPPTPPQTAPHP